MTWAGGLELDVTDAAREWLAINGFDPRYGARPLRRLVPSAIGDQLARELLADEIRDGDAVQVDLDDTAAGGTGALTVHPRVTHRPSHGCLSLSSARGGVSG